MPSSFSTSLATALENNRLAIFTKDLARMGVEEIDDLQFVTKEDMGSWTEIQWRRFCSFRDTLLRDEQSQEWHVEEPTTNSSSNKLDEHDIPLKRRCGGASSDRRRDRIQTRSPIKRRAGGWENSNRYRSPSSNRHSSSHRDSDEPILRRKPGRTNYWKPAMQCSSSPWAVATADSRSVPRGSVSERCKPEKLPPWRDHSLQQSHEDVKRQQKRSSSQPHPGQHDETKSKSSSRAHPGKHRELQTSSSSQAHPEKHQEPKKQKSFQQNPGQHQEPKRATVKQGFLKRTLAKKNSNAKGSKKHRKQSHKTR